MGQFGIWIIILGVGSFVLNLIGVEFRLLMWVDLWGPGIGTAIRLGLIALGVLLVVVGRMAGGSGGASSESKEEK